ncbi:hypothetical protein D9M68_852420 [compost metagenome]
MKLYLCEREVPFGKSWLLVNEKGEILPGQREVKLHCEPGCLPEIIVTFLANAEHGVACGEPPKAPISRIDQLVEQAKAEINEMAAKAKAKILGYQISIGFPGVLDAREASQIAGALARHAGPRYA